MKNMKFICAAFAGGLALAGCMQGGGSQADDSDLPYIFDNFADIPVPEGMKMNMSETRIYGRENDWNGTISFSSKYDMNGVFDFYVSEMPKFGWLEITSIRSDNSVMTYIRDRRVAIIQISIGTFGGTNVKFTVSPAPPGIRSVNSISTADGAGVAGVGSRTPQSKIAPMRGPGSAATRGVSTGGNAADKSAPGSLGLGAASNMNYPSQSRGVGQPIQ